MSVATDCLPPNQFVSEQGLSGDVRTSFAIATEGASGAMLLDSKELITMIKSKKKITAVMVATFFLFALGVVGFAQRHLMVASPRPEV